MRCAYISLHQYLSCGTLKHYVDVDVASSFSNELHRLLSQRQTHEHEDEEEHAPVLAPPPITPCSHAQLMNAEMLREKML